MLKKLLSETPLTKVGLLRGAYADNDEDKTRVPDESGTVNVLV